MSSYFVKSRPSSAMDDDFMIYGTWDEHSVKEKLENV